MHTNEGNQIRVYSCALVVTNPYPCYPCNRWLKNCKHAAFNRDFRGDTIHPSTLELMHELGLLDEFLKQPHQEVRELRAVVNSQVVPVADFRKLPTRCKFIAFMPQWDFLTFLSGHAKDFPEFR